MAAALFSHRGRECADHPQGSVEIDVERLPEDLPGAPLCADARVVDEEVG